MKQQPMKKIFGLYLAIVGVVIIIIGLIMAGMETEGWVLFWGTGFVIICIGVWGFNNSGTKEDTSTTNSVMDEKIETEATKPIDIIYEILIDEGFIPIIYSTGNYIEFKIEGDLIRIQFDVEDENYIQLGCWVYDYEQKDKHSALDTANRVNIYVKYAYIVVHSNQIIAHSDIFIANRIEPSYDNYMHAVLIKDIKTVLFKHIYACLYARTEFYKITNEMKYSLN